MKSSPVFRTVEAWRDALPEGSLRPAIDAIVTRTFSNYI